MTKSKSTRAIWTYLFPHRTKRPRVHNPSVDDRRYKPDPMSFFPLDHCDLKAPMGSKACMILPHPDSIPAPAQTGRTVKKSDWCKNIRKDTNYLQNQVRSQRRKVANSQKNLVMQLLLARIANTQEEWCTLTQNQPDPHQISYPNQSYIQTDIESWQRKCIELQRQLDIMRTMYNNLLNVPKDVIRVAVSNIKNNIQVGKSIPTAKMTPPDNASIYETTSSHVSHESNKNCAKNQVLSLAESENEENNDIVEN